MSLLINAYATVANPPMPDFPCQNLLHRNLDDAELTAHLNGFLGYIFNAGDGKMNARRYALYRHIQRVKHHFSFAIDDDQFDQFNAWAKQANVIIYLPDGTVRNAEMAILQNPDGSFDPDATMPYPSEALQRKAKTEHYLNTLGLTSPTSLPPVVAESEVIVRSAEEIAYRALALMITGIQAQSFLENAPLDPNVLQQRCPIGYATLSDHERAFIHSMQPTEQDLNNMSWRYEALSTLEWAINWQAQLPFANQICPVADLIDHGMKYNQQQDQSLSLKPVSELLDALDLHFRLHWIIRDCEINDKEIPASINSGVVHERHYTLNWLTNFENAAWDDVDTPT